MTTAGLLLVYPHGWADVIGLSLLGLALLTQWLRRPSPALRAGGA